MEILFIAFLILLNGVFAMSEIAVVSARRVRLAQLSKAGDTRAKTALELHDSPNIFLSTIQIGITFIGVLLGAIGEAVVAGDVAALLVNVPVLAPYSEVLAFTLVVVAIAYFSLIVGELVPKRLALQNPESISRVVAAPMRALSRLAYPAVRLLSVSMDAVLRLIGAQPSGQPPVTEDEIKSMIEEGTRVGVFLKAEQDLLKNIIRLPDRSMSMLMRTRSDIVFLDLEDPPQENLKKIIALPHSRFPVARGGLDNVVGVVQAKDLLARMLAGQDANIEAVMREPLLVPETMSPLGLLEMFRANPNDIALVVDEYGEMRGMVTLNDILAAIVGGLPVEGEVAEPKVVRRDDGSFLLDGMLSIDECKEALNLPTWPGEESGDYETVGGFVMMQMGRIPAISDHFEWSGLRFEVVDMDGKRIDRILVTPLRPAQ